MESETRDKPSSIDVLFNSCSIVVLTDFSFDAFVLKLNGKVRVTSVLSGVSGGRESSLENRCFLFSLGDGVLIIKVLFDFREGGGVMDRGLLLLMDLFFFEPSVVLRSILSETVATS